MQYMQRPLLMILRSLEIFSKLSLSHLQSLSEALTEVTFQAGQVIVEKVSAFRFSSFVASGITANIGSLELVLHQCHLSCSSLVKQYGCYSCSGCGNNQIQQSSFVTRMVKPN